MRNRTEFGGLNLSGEIIFLLVFLVVCLRTPAQAQKSQPSAAGPPKYDLHTEAKFKGTVEELKVPPKGRERDHAFAREMARTPSTYISARSLSSTTWV